eukprot:m.104229 g.104229  ORF g.104229 m.104229 type:complete len:130 (+) comp22440_c0_seq4:189-578(+)
MYTHFVHYPHDGRLFTMISSWFSHKEPWHLLFNAMATISFAAIPFSDLGYFQTIAFGIGGGCAATLVNQIFTVYSKKISGGLGFSGVLMAVLGFVAVTHPDLKVHHREIPRNHNTYIKNTKGNSGVRAK